MSDIAKPYQLLIKQRYRLDVNSPYEGSAELTPWVKRLFEYMREKIKS